MKNLIKHSCLFVKFKDLSAGLGFIILVICATLLFAQSKANAQVKPTLTISPFLQDVRFSGTDPTKDFFITLTNNSSKTLSLSMSILDFGSLNDSGGIVFSGTKSSSLLKKYGLSTWLQLSDKIVSIEPGKRATVTATIINDSSLQPGGHYAAVVASVIGPDIVAGEQIEINQKLSSLVLATKIGGEKYDLKLQNIDTRGSRLSLPKTVSLRFNNPGNVHVVPRGTVKLVSPSGTVVSQGVINEDSSFVLPETSRQLHVDMHSVNSAGLWPALYRIEVAYRYDGIEQFAHKSQTVYFLNLKVTVCITGFIIVLWWVLYKKRHLIKKIKKPIKLKKAEAREEPKSLPKKTIKITVK